MGRLHTFVVTLRRETRDTNWGLRLVGGSDLATPLIVTRVTPGTPAGRDLARGDIIAKIDDYDARDLRHEDAQNLFKNAQNQIKLVVQRDADREVPRAAPMASRAPISNAVPPPFRTPSPKAGQGNAWRGPESLPRSTPLLQPQLSVQHEGEYRSIMLSPVSSRNDDVVDESIGSQPYRTTPLVLPGAKVRREPGPTESYLRHHPNPAMRAPPHHDYRDTLMKQKVAESVLQRVVGEEANKVVHKQFNSPINLYSEQNIANSIRQQTSPLPSKAFDPAKSDTFRALQEQAPPAHELPSPQTKLFTQPAKKPVPPKSKQQHEAKLAGKQTTFVNSLHEEHIQQSNSFKRLMYNVLGDTEF
ncbi:PDZ and LIM domain protein 7 isoform X1 [Zerene cesonia]|uniref:PDZ and LIM domain protein 7 isoform X1 n=1 Tax=Zerene cesonia TaxID=33412 RepID=UPI0018E5852C|nr:PDZ and LIM domain protein 7 isoform X1 [Zerene cesonia]